MLCEFYIVIQIRIIALAEAAMFWQQQATFFTSWHITCVTNIILSVVLIVLGNIFGLMVRSFTIMKKPYGLPDSATCNSERLSLLVYVQCFFFIE